MPDIGVRAGPGRIGRLALAATVALVLSMSSLVTSAPANQQASTRGTCIRAGLIKPKILKPRFWLQIYEYQVGPSGYVPFFLEPMPAECAGEYSRSLSIHFRYKTTRRGWRTYHGISNEHLTTWTVLWNQDGGTEATLGPGLIDEESSRSPWGTLKNVVAQAKLTVKESTTKKVVGRRLFGVPVRFAHSPRREPLR